MLLNLDAQGEIASILKEFFTQDSLTKKTLLLLNDFEVSTPVSGGQIRINRLYTHLSNRYNIVLLCFNNGPKVKATKITKDFLEISVPKTMQHKTEEERIDRQFVHSAADIINSYMCERNELLVMTAKILYSIADVIIAIHPYMIMLLKELEGKPVIYESLNTECELKKFLQGHPLYEALISQVRLVEMTACDKSKFIISVSDDDREKLRQLLENNHKEIFTVQNGVDLKKSDIPDSNPNIKAIFNNRPVILFIGSAHPPNIGAVNFIVNGLAPWLPDCCFAIIGSVCERFTQNQGQNIVWFGRLDEARKDAVVRNADLALNPMISGSGSNLKIAEYFAAKIPTVTTVTGARGYKIENRKEAIICDLREFQSQIELLLRDKELRERLAANALDYVVKELDWHVLAGKYIKILEEKIVELRKPKKSCLHTTPDVEEMMIHDLQLAGVTVTDLAIDPENYALYFKMARYLEDFPHYYRANIFEKSLEHYIGAILLNLNGSDVYIDVASQNSPVPQIYNRLLGPATYRQDLDFPPGLNGFTIGGNAASMPVPDGFATKMGLHCSFEHFEGNSDIGFVREAARVLKPGGAVCITPLYLSEEYSILTDPLISVPQNVEFDKDAVICRLPGWNNRHGRFYNVKHFLSRVRNNAPDFDITVYRITNARQINESCYLRFALLLKRRG